MITARHICLALLTLHLVAAAWAQSQIPLWTWQFTPAQYVVGSLDPVVIHATISVDPTSPVPLRMGGVGGAVGGDLIKIYTISLGDLWDYRSFGTGLEPGQSLTLHWGTFVPRAEVQQGRYHGDPYVLGLGTGGVDYVAQAPLNNLIIDVVPEPRTAVLLAAGFVAFGLRRMLKPHRA